RVGNSRRWRRTGHAENGWVAEENSGHILDHGHRDLRDRRNSGSGGLFQQRRNLVARLSGKLDLLADRGGDGVHHFVLHVPTVVHDLLWRVQRLRAWT